MRDLTDDEIERFDFIMDGGNVSNAELKTAHYILELELELAKQVAKQMRFKFKYKLGQAVRMMGTTDGRVGVFIISQREYHECGDPDSPGIQVHYHGRLLTDTGGLDGETRRIPENVLTAAEQLWVEMAPEFEKAIGGMNEAVEAAVTEAVKKLKEDKYDTLKNLPATGSESTQQDLTIVINLKRWKIDPPGPTITAGLIKAFADVDGDCDIFRALPGDDELVEGEEIKIKDGDQFYTVPRKILGG